MFESSGILHYDPLPNTKHFEPNWALLLLSDDIAAYYAWHMKKFGIEIDPHNLWGTHISVIKGDEVDPVLWKKYDGFEVKFHYTHLVRYDNGKHAWVDVYSEDLSEIRKELGLEPKRWFHLTVGKLKRPFTAVGGDW